MPCMYLRVHKYRCVPAAQNETKESGNAQCAATVISFDLLLMRTVEILTDWLELTATLQSMA